MSRPRPNPSELTAPFWAAAREGRLVYPHCNACGRAFFTPQVVCPRCLSEDWTYAESSGRGVVYSFTVVHRSPTPEFRTPYVLAVVDLEEAWTMLGNVVGCEAEAVRIGLPVEVAWEQIDDEFVLPVFVPAA